MVFASKVDRWIVMVTIVPMVAAAGAIAAATVAHPGREMLFPIAMLLLLAFLITRTFRATDYRIEGEELTVRSGPFRWRIEIGSIGSIRPTRSAVSAPALSLDRLRIEYGGRAILVSPREKEQFIRELLAINPHIRT